MKAFTLTTAGATPALLDRPAPSPAAGQILVRVHASSVNALDVGIALGRFEQMGIPHQYPLTLGRDMAGVVESIGQDAGAFAVGDRVFGEIPFRPPISAGTWAEYALVDHRNLARVPDAIDLVTAGAAPLAAVTAIQLVDALDLAAGQTVLIVGATGGVGSIAAQLATAVGATVVAPGLPGDEQFLRQLGVADIWHRDDDLVAAVRDRHPRGVDAIIDAVTPYQLTAYEAALGDGGRITSPTNAAGEGPGRTNVMHTPTTTLLDRVAGYLADGTIAVAIQRIYTLDQANGALQAFRSGHTLGKIAIQIS
ncbi:NADP-dependent oxidoreductase [Cryptosporangium phraense]|uniref:NADP-dependent oxidoreductase n=1 Tax=Cryptosporangium phraense TaxID=2593070 RepID=UPI0014797FEE|nr:NADP-dependent oxidoreductase [Cryptosporangium phraense]